jgi:hypothetical protein
MHTNQASPKKKCITVDGIFIHKNVISFNIVIKINVNKNQSDDENFS